MEVTMTLLQKQVKLSPRLNEALPAAAQDCRARGGKSEQIENDPGAIKLHRHLRGTRSKAISFSKAGHVAETGLATSKWPVSAKLFNGTGSPARFAAFRYPSANEFGAMSSLRPQKRTCGTPSGSILIADVSA
jgi:hypothetical protein